MILSQLLSKSFCDLFMEDADYIEVGVHCKICGVGELKIERD